MCDMGLPHRLARNLTLLLLALAVVETAVVFVYYLRFPPGDFDAYRNAALAVRDGGRLYETALIWRDLGYANAAPSPQPTETTPYIYPPLLAVVMVPFTWLPHGIAHALWCALMVGSVAGAAAVIGRLLSDGSTRQWVAVASAVTIVLFVSQPVRASLTSKQIDGTILLLLALSLLAFLRRRDTLAGLWFGLAITIKPFVVLLTIYYLWKGGWRTVVVAGSCSAVLALAPFPFLAPGTFSDYLNGTGYYAGPVYVASPMIQSVYAVLVRTFMVNQFAQPLVDAPWLVLPLRVVLSGLILLFALSRVSRQRDLPPTTLALEYGLILGVGLLAIPVAEDFHFTYLALAFAAGALVLVRQWQTRHALAERRPLPSLLPVVYAGYLGVLCLPALRLISHAFYRYGDGPVGYPLALLMSFQAVLLLVGVLLLASTLQADRRQQAETRPAQPVAGTIQQT